MAFRTKTWTDRLSEFPGRRRLKDASTGAEMVVDVTRAEGTVLKEGDAFSKENMDDLESRIKDAFDELGGSVADGKALIASAITSKGVSTAASASFATMASNINKIRNASQITNVGSNHQSGDASGNGSWQNKSVSYNIGPGVYIFWVCCSRAENISVAIPAAYTLLNSRGNTGTSYGGFSATYKITVDSGTTRLSFSANILAGSTSSGTSFPGVFSSGVVGA